MSRTAAGVRTDRATRLAEFQRRRPEWQTWLSLLGEAERALADPAWGDLLNVEELEAGSPAASSQTPLLHGETLNVNADRVRAWVRHLASIASQGGDARLAQLRGYRPPSAQAVRLVAAAVRQDAAEMGALAAEAGIDRGVLISIAHLAAFPLLQSCGARARGSDSALLDQRVLSDLRSLAHTRGTTRTRPDPATAVWSLRFRMAGPVVLLHLLRRTRARAAGIAGDRREGR